MTIFSSLHILLLLPLIHISKSFILVPISLPTEKYSCAYLYKQSFIQRAISTDIELSKTSPKYISTIDSTVNTSKESILNSSSASLSLIFLSFIQGACVGIIRKVVRFFIQKCADPLRCQMPILLPLMGGLLASALACVNGKDMMPNLSALVNEDNFLIKSQMLRLVAAVIVVGSGCSVALAAPTVEMGITLALCIAKKYTGRPKTLLIMSGAAAGFSAEYDAPLSGFMYALEKVSLYFKEPTTFRAKELLVIAASALGASLVSKNGVVSREKTVLSSLVQESTLSFSDLPLIVAVGIIGGIMCKCLSAGKDCLHNFFKRIPFQIKPAVGGLSSMAAAALGYPQNLTLGYKTLSQIACCKLSRMVVVRFFLIKCITTLLCTASGMVGGFGSHWLLAGGALGSLSTSFLETRTTNTIPWTLIGSTTIVAAAYQAPITISLLLIEMTRNMSLCVPFLLASCVASFVADLKMPPTRGKQN